MDRTRPLATDRDLLAQTDTLVREPEVVLADLSLLERLTGVGRPVRIGSSAANVMTLPDIDIGVLCPSLDSSPIMATMQPLFDHPNVKRMNFIDERGMMQSVPGPENEGTYCGVRYLNGGTLDGKTWTIDIWFFPESAPRPECAIRDRLLACSSAERLAILRIKDDLIRSDRYGRDVHGIDVYRAVRDRSVRTIGEL